MRENGTHDEDMPMSVSHRLFEHEDLVADCACCGALAIGMRLEGHSLYPQCAMCKLGQNDENWHAFPLRVDVYRLIPGVHNRLPVAASS
jgi:hypothetical protein